MTEAIAQLGMTEQTILNRMLKAEIPLTVSNYLSATGAPEKDWGPEYLASLPWMLADDLAEELTNGR